MVPFPARPSWRHGHAVCRRYAGSVLILSRCGDDAFPAGGAIRPD